MLKFPVDAPKKKVIKAFKSLGFKMIREREHIVMQRENEDGIVTPLVMPNHSNIKSGTLRAIYKQQVFMTTISVMSKQYVAR